jgi:DNA-binding HxlR family transcriptional regulator
MTKTPINSGSRSGCPIACSLDLLGDKWTLLIIRDLIYGKHRFADFQASVEQIPTNTLADRLRRMEESNVVEKLQYAQKPPRFEYHLTAKGKALLPVLQELCLWGIKHMPGTSVLSDTFTHRPGDKRRGPSHPQRIVG